MYNAEAIQGSPSQGTRSIRMAGEYSASQFIDISIAGVAANSVSFEVSNGMQLMEFSRALGDGFSLDAPVALIVAHHASDGNWNIYHSGRWDFEVRLVAFAAFILNLHLSRW